MFLQTIFFLFVYYLLINKQIFFACVEEENMQLVVQGEKVLIGLTKYFRSSCRQNPKAPFGYLEMDKNIDERKLSFEDTMSSIFKEYSQHEAEEAWKSLYNLYKIPDVPCKSLIFAGQPGLLLLVVFRQMMCEAHYLSSKITYNSRKNQARNYYFSIDAYNDILKLMPQRKKEYIGIPAATLCIENKLFLLTERQRSKLNGYMEKLKSPPRKSYFLDDCFDMRLKLDTDIFLNALKSSKSACSVSLMRDLHFSFDYLDTIKTSITEKNDMMISLLQSSWYYKLKLGKNIMRYNHWKLRMTDKEKKRLSSLEESPDEDSTEDSTDGSTEDSTDGSTEDSTEGSTVSSTETVTEIPNKNVEILEEIPTRKNRKTTVKDFFSKPIRSLINRFGGKKKNPTEKEEKKEILNAKDETSDFLKNEPHSGVDYESFPSNDYSSKTLPSIPATSSPKPSTSFPKSSVNSHSSIFPHNKLPEKETLDSSGYHTLGLPQMDDIYISDSVYV